MDVITEGVEHWSQVNFLKDMDCNMVQGFLFDKPVPEPEFREKLVMKQYDISQIKDFEYRKQA
jgi:EAL domain-containing protein (putative c-di-GMP-specific phosphodiesterase class I)